MDRKQIFILHLLDCAIHSIKPHPEEFLPEEWEKLLQDCMGQGIFAVVFPAVEQLFRQGHVPAAVAEKWKKSTISAVTGQIRRNIEYEAVYTSFMGKGVQTLLFKGPALSELYPEEHLRITGDMDLLIAGDMDTAQQILKERGYTRLASPHEESVLDFRKNEMQIELHQSLFEENGAGRMHIFNEIMVPQEIWERRQNQQKSNGLLYAVFCPEDHLCYLLCHMAKHFIYAGFGLRHLADLTLFAQRYAGDIAWESFWRRIRLAGIEKFTCALFSICIKYLGLPAGCVPFPSDSAGSQPIDDLLEDILDAGIFGVRTPARVHARSMTGRITAEQNNRMQLMLRAVFPSAGYLKYQYPYLERRPWLLPAAWGQRLYRFLADLGKRRQERSSLKETSAVCSNRLNLLKEYELMDEKQRLSLH